jgi:hypothetical protein
MSSSDAFGSLAALFTTGGNGTARDGAPAPAVGEVTVALVGNLPVMAGPWMSQFADEVARGAGPTALVRFERDEVTVELLRADGRQVPPAGPGALERWLPRAASGIRRWVLCVPADTPPEEVLAVGQGVVLLTGADEAAVTGAYLRLKYLADQGINGGAPVSHVGLVVVGAAPDQAAAAAQRVADAARGFLGIEVEALAPLQRIGRVESSARAVYAAADCPDLVGFASELARARAAGSSRFDAAPMPMEPAVEPKPIAAPASAAAPAHATPAPAPVVADPVAAPAAAARPAPAAPASRPAPAYAALPVAQLPERLVPLLRGLRPLGIACPVAHEVELALDDDRRMHVVGRADQLARVRIAHTWATMHRELLGMAFPELKGGFEVRERILLGDAREAITLHGTGVLLDVLVVAETPNGPVSVVLPLNDPSTAG